MPEINSLFFTLGGNTRQFQRAMSQASGSVDRMHQTLTGLGTAVTAAFAGIALPIRNVIDTFAGFEQGLVRAGAIAGAETAGELAALGETAKGLASTTKFTATEITQAYNAMAMAGQDASQIMANIEPTLQLATAGALELGDAANIVTNIMAGFGKTSEELAETNDAVVTAITSSNVSVQQLGEAFAKVGPTASALQIDFNNVAAALGVLGNAGIQGSVAGTGLGRALLQLVNPTKTVTETIQKLGAQFFDQNGKVKDFVGILEELERTGASTTDIFKIFGMFGGRTIQALVGQGVPALEKLNAKINDTRGIAGKLAKKEMETLRGALNSMAASVESAKISLGESLEPAVRAVVSVISKLAGVFSELHGSIQVVITIVPPAAVAVWGLVKAYKALNISIVAATKSLIPFIAAFVGVAAGVGAVVKAFKFFEVDVGGGLKKFDVWITKFLVDAVREAKLLVLPAFAAIGGAIDALKDKDFARVWDRAADASKKAVAQINRDAVRTKDVIDKTGSGLIAQVAKQQVGELEKGAKELVEGIKEGIDFAFGAIGESLGETLSLFKKDDVIIVEKIEDATAGIAKNLKEAAKTSGSLTQGLAAPKQLTPVGHLFDIGQPGARDTTSKMDRLNFKVQQADVARSVERFSEGLGHLTNAMAAGAPQLSAAISSIGQALTSGGPMAALAAAGMEILTRMRSFQNAMKTLETIFVRAVDALSRVLEPFFMVFQELFTALAPIVNLIAQMAGLIQVLNPSFLIMQMATEQLAKVSNAIMQAVVTVAGWINKVLDMIAKALKKIRLGSLARAVEKAKIDVNAIEQSARARQTERKEIDKVTKAFSAMANVPEILKIDSLRMAAIQERNRSIRDAPPEIQQAISQSRGVLIENVVVNAQGQSVTKVLKDIADREAEQNRTASPTAAPKRTFAAIQKEAGAETASAAYRAAARNINRRTGARVNTGSVGASLGSRV